MGAERRVTNHITTGLFAARPTRRAEQRRASSTAVVGIQQSAAAMRRVIKGLHHAAYRCRDAELTRQFYEDFLGLPLVDAFDINVTITNQDTTAARESDVLHVFFAMADGSCVAFFQEPGEPVSKRAAVVADLSSLILIIACCGIC